MNFDRKRVAPHPNVQLYELTEHCPQKNWGSKLVLAWAILFVGIGTVIASFFADRWPDDFFSGTIVPTAIFGGSVFFFLLSVDGHPIAFHKKIFATAEHVSPPCTLEVWRYPSGHLELLLKRSSSNWSKAGNGQKVIFQYLTPFENCVTRPSKHEGTMIFRGAVHLGEDHPKVYTTYASNGRIGADQPEWWTETWSLHIEEIASCKLTFRFTDGDGESICLPVGEAIMFLDYTLQHPYIQKLSELFAGLVVTALAELPSVYEQKDDAEDTMLEMCKIITCALDALDKTRNAIKSKEVRYVREKMHEAILQLLEKKEHESAKTYLGWLKDNRSPKDDDQPTEATT